MKRFGLFGFILVGILAQSLLAFQNPPAEDLNSYIVLLKEPSLLQMSLQWEPEGSVRLRRQIWNTPEARRYVRHIADRQAGLLDALAEFRIREGKPNRLELLDRHTFLLNMLLVRASREEIEQLAERSEVKAVYPNAKRYPLLDSAAAVMGAPAFWEAVGGIDNAGEGIKIGIVDSGISQDHPMFAGEGLQAPAGFPLGDSAFTNSKVIVARTYVSPIFGLKQESNNTPQDDLGHGSQVAAIAAGRPVDTPHGMIQGIAPKAFLGNYKVFGNPSINPTTTVAAVIKAIEDAVQDGMDILNLSLGGEAREVDSDPEVMAIAMAVQAGVAVVTAVGNTGPEPGTVTSPGTSPDAITVGASSNGRVFASALQIASDVPVPSEVEQIAYLPGTGKTIDEAIGPLPIVSIVPLDSTELACSPLPEGSLTREVVLIRRGECLFSQKVQNVLGAGAEGIVVYNNVAGGAVVMAGLEGVQQPAVMIEMDVGEQLRDFLLDVAPAEVTFLAESDLFALPTEADIVSSFSGRGPSIDQSIKPDLTAPGEDIHTASNQVLPDPEFSLRISGTSFAAPMASGAAALVKQLHPDWAELLPAPDLAAAIKSALVNTASKTTTWEGKPARLIHTGNGRLDLARALKANASLDPVSVSFGLVDEDISSQIKRNIELTNLATDSQTFQIELAETVGNQSTEISVSPSILTLSPGEEADLTVQIDLFAPLAPGVFEGFVRVTSLGDETELTASVRGAITVENNSITIPVSQAGGAPHSTIAEAIESAQPGSVVEVTDSNTYRENLAITYNADGLLLNGITLRASPGQFPVIDARELGGGSPAITILDLDRVTIEGLRVKGGSSGISYQNSSGIILNNTIEDTLAGTSSYAIELTNSRAHIFENRITNQRSGIGVFTSSSLIQSNRIGDLEGQAGDGTGIFVSGFRPAGIFDNVIANYGATRPDGQGIQISNAEVLAKGNLISGIRGSLANGVLASGRFSQIVSLDNRVEESGRFGISLRSGARGLVDRNLIQNNAGAAIRAEGGSEVEIRSSHLLDNGTGIGAVSSEVKLSDSLIARSASADSGDGISSTLGTLEVLNGTIYGNSGFGVRLTSVLTTVSNTIFDQNSGGDLSGFSGGALTNNLIADGQFEGQDGNFAADPKFSDPLNSDFSLQQDSPAIDRGELTSLSSVDLFSHRRIVDGDNDGIARVDLGAIESASPYWIARILPVLSVSEGNFIGLAIANGFREPASLLLRYYDRNGELLGTFEPHTLEQGQQTAFLLREAFSPLQEGWVEILSSQPDVMSFTLLGDRNLSFLGGTELSPVLSSRLLFPEIRSDGGQETHFYLINPNQNDVNVTLTWVRSDGPSLDKVLSMKSRGILSETFREIFGIGTGGYVTATTGAGERICALEIFGNSDSRGGLSALDYGGGGTLLHAVQLASSQHIETTVNMINTDSATDLTLVALDEEGNQIQSVVVKDFPEGGQLRRRAGDLFSFPSDPFVGRLRVESNNGAVLGNVTFGDPAETFLAALPLQRHGAREFVLSHVANTAELFSGLALANPALDNALVTLEIFDAGGERRKVSFLELAPGQKLARFLEELVPDVGILTGGHVRVRSNIPIFGFEILGNRSFRFLSAVPQHALAR